MEPDSSDDFLQIVAPFFIDSNDDDEPSSSDDRRKQRMIAVYCQIAAARGISSNSARRASTNPREAAPDAPMQDAPMQEAPMQEAPMQEAPVAEAPIQDAPMQDAPMQQAPVQGAPMQEAPGQESPRPPQQEEPDSTSPPLPPAENAQPPLPPPEEEEVEEEEQERGTPNFVPREMNLRLILPSIRYSYRVVVCCERIEMGSFTIHPMGVPEELENENPNPVQPEVPPRRNVIEAEPGFVINRPLSPRLAAPAEPPPPRAVQDNPPNERPNAAGISLNVLPPRRRVNLPQPPPSNDQARARTPSPAPVNEPERSSSPLRLPLFYIPHDIFTNPGRTAGLFTKPPVILPPSASASNGRCMYIPQDIYMNSPGIAAAFGAPINMPPPPPLPPNLPPFHNSNNMFSRPPPTLESFYPSRPNISFPPDMFSRPPPTAPPSRFLHEPQNFPFLPFPVDFSKPPPTIPYLRALRKAPSVHTQPPLPTTPAPPEIVPNPPPTAAPSNAPAVQLNENPPARQNAANSSAAYSSGPAAIERPPRPKARIPAPVLPSSDANNLSIAHSRPSTALALSRPRPCANAPTLPAASPRASAISTPTSGKQSLAPPLSADAPISPAVSRAPTALASDPASDLTAPTRPPVIALNPIFPLDSIPLPSTPPPSATSHSALESKSPMIKVPKIRTRIVPNNRWLNLYGPTRNTRKTLKKG